jgi:hypothetical protein
MVDFGSECVQTSVSYRRSLDPVYDNEKKNWRILTDNSTVYEFGINKTKR